ncbi:MAG: tetratricopeptide repeat protein [Planctomycetes bacterium]|nr:tetratricopeptide repeat protein [Planctomycetota bacterium]
MRAWALLVLALAACKAASAGPYAPESEARRDPVRAQELSARAADLIATDVGEAERVLREALGADLFFGPAHNNLGVVYLKQKKLYEAAGEFEWARKLMPGHPDPRMNLALTLEQAGQTDEAIATYKTALEVWPGHLGSIQALAKLCVVSNRSDPELAGWLDQIAVQGETEPWREWARRENSRSHYQ